MDARLVCPNCHVQSNYAEPGMGWNDFSCPSCKKAFKSLLATVRAKKSRGSKKSQSREFDVRVHTGGPREEMIQFTASGYDDFELRSSDTAAFSYFKDRLHVVQNFTIGQYKVVRQPGLGVIAWALIIAGAIAIIVLMAR